MSEAIEIQFKQLNTSWERLLNRLLATRSKKGMLQISAALFERLDRRRPEELAFVSDTLRGALDQLESRVSEDASQPTRADGQVPSTQVPEPDSPLYFALLSLHDVTVSFHYAAQRELGDKVWIDFVNSKTPRAILLSIDKHGTRTNAQLRETIGLSESRMSQRLRPLREARLIDFTKDGQRRLYHLTELGREHVRELRAAEEPALANAEPEVCTTDGNLQLASETSDTGVFFAMMASQNDATNDDTDIYPKIEMQSDPRITELNAITQEINKKSRSQSRSQRPESSTSHWSDTNAGKSFEYA